MFHILAQLIGGMFGGNRSTDPQVGSGSQGAALAVNPTILAVHPALQARAIALLQAQQNARTGMSYGTWATGIDSYHYDTAMCMSCGSAHAISIPHECPTISDIDKATINAIQILAEGGIEPQEIADDLGIVLAWRGWRWGSSDQQLHGIGNGGPASWKPDEPMCAVCAQMHCGGRGMMCGTAQRPICRIHAIKQKCGFLDYGPDIIVGQVAMWGEVIECEKGYLATRAYPIALPSKMLARAYRVCQLPPSP